MKIKILKSCLWIFLCIIFPQTPTFSQEQAVSVGNSSTTDELNNEVNLIHPGDLIDVDVIGSYDYDWRGTIDAEGFLSGINFVENPIFALCRTGEMVAEDIAAGYSHILRDPKVVVKILDRSNRPQTVIYGAIKTPQRFLIKRPVLLNELIITAGGITDKTSGEIQIFRPKSASCLTQDFKNLNPSKDSIENRERFVKARQEDGSQYINVRIPDLIAGKTEANPQILSGDIITVQEAQSVYVTGGVENPKQIPVHSQLTLSRAISSAGGLKKSAKGKKITIFRRQGTETKLIEVDFEKIKADSVEDVVLQPLDIVEVHQSSGEDRKFTPLKKSPETRGGNADKLPLRIID